MMAKGWLLLLLLAVVLPATPAQGTAKVNLVTPTQLKSMLGKPQLMIIDVRTEVSWIRSDRKIKGAVREDPEKAAVWGPQLPKGKEFVLYCS